MQATLLPGLSFPSCFCIPPLLWIRLASKLLEHKLGLVPSQHPHATCHERGRTVALNLFTHGIFHTVLVTFICPENGKFGTGLLFAHL